MDVGPKRDLVGELFFIGSILNSTSFRGNLCAVV